jgi:hypothetical protein
MTTTKQLRDLAKLNKSIKQKSLDYKVGKEYEEKALKEFYKPVIDVVSKGQELVKTSQKEMKNQALLVPLIKSLSKHPRIIEVLIGNNTGEDLTEEEQNILKQLSHIDEQTLLTLIDYYEQPERKQPIVDPDLPDLPEYTRIPTNLTSDKLGEWLIKTCKSNPNTVRLLFEEREDITVHEVKTAISDYVTFLVRNNTPPNFIYKPWSTIKTVDNEFYLQLGKIAGKKLKGSPKAGTGIADMIKKLEILYAEKQAGNNNVMGEVEEILNILRRNNIIDIDMLKNISKRFK